MSQVFGAIPDVLVFRVLHLYCSPLFNLLCRSAESISHNFHFFFINTEISIRNLKRNNATIYIRVCLAEYVTANKTIDLISVISLTVNVLTIELLRKKDKIPKHYSATTDIAGLCFSSFNTNEDILHSESL